ncbi:MAG: hypothetical protein IJP74_08225 [Prevotella sp.]|nr:hypothetical protein [Prevotella sp.]
MRHLLIVTFIFASTLVGHAQTHVRKAIDNMLSEHPEWVVNSGKSESAIKSGTQSNRIYELSITDLAAIDSLLSAFEADKMNGYSYIRTSAAYNQAMQKRRRTTVTLQNGERLESHSTEYSFVSLSVVDSGNKSYRTNYILKWYLPKDGRVEAKLYILNGPRPNNQ